MHARILLVTANPTHARFFQDSACVNDFQWTVVQHLATAIDRVKAETFDLALLALSLPDNPGPNSYHRLRAVAPNLAIVLLTRPDEEDLAIAALKDGGQDYIVLGDNPKTGSLRNTLLNAIQRKKALLDLQNWAVTGHPTQPDSLLNSPRGRPAAAMVRAAGK